MSSVKITSWTANDVGEEKQPWSLVAEPAKYGHSVIKSRRDTGSEADLHVIFVESLLETTFFVHMIVHP